MSLTVFGLLSLALLAPEGPQDSAPTPSVEIGEGAWLLYKGSLKLTKGMGNEAETLNPSVELGYLGLGSPDGAAGAREAVLLRSGESQEEEETQEMVARFAEKFKFTHPIVLKGGAASEIYDVRGAKPTAFWIDPLGRVALREVGFDPEMEKEIERRINDLLKARDEAGEKPASGGIGP